MEGAKVGSVMLWVKSFHIVFMVAWFAGLFYLPRLFVYHAMTQSEESSKMLKTMERRLYFGIMAPAALATILTGIWLLYGYAWAAYHKDLWLYFKLALVAVLVIYHLLCGRWLKSFRENANTHSHRFFRWINEIPLLFLVAVVLLVILKPAFH